MAMELAEIASLVDGQLIGDGTLVCTGANPPSEAGPADVTMLDQAGNADSIGDCQAVAIITVEASKLEKFPRVIVEDPHAAFAKVVAHFRPPVDCCLPSAGIDPTARVADTAVVHDSAVVGPGVSIGARTRIMPGVVILPHCQIGDDCILHAGVTLYEYTEIGDRVIIHAGSVLGANGFGYRLENGRHIPTAQLGFVAIESDVEIGAAVTIDRGTYGATRVCEGTKIDNQVMIGHNCRIGRHNLLCSQVGIAGSCRTGDYVVMAGQVGLADHITLGDKVVVGAQAGVMDDLESDQVYLGSPATKQREQMQIMAVERRLPEMRRDLKQLRRELDQVIKSLNDGDANDPSPAKADRRAA